VVGRQSSSQVIVRRAGQEKIVALAHAGKFSVFKPETIALSAGDQIRITKNFHSQVKRFRNNELHVVTAVTEDKLILEQGEIVVKGALHLDQGFAVTSHAAQGKTVDQVIVSVPIDSFSQANEAQFYVSMSRARETMYLFTDGKVALREAVTRPSGRLSPLELMSDQKAVERLQSASRHMRGRTPAPSQQQIAHEAPERSHER
jgi:hypothetical protein